MESNAEQAIRAAMPGTGSPSFPAGIRAGTGDPGCSDNSPAWTSVLLVRVLPPVLVQSLPRNHTPGTLPWTPSLGSGPQVVFRVQSLLLAQCQPLGLFPVCPAASPPRAAPTCSSHHQPLSPLGLGPLVEAAEVHLRALGGGADVMTCKQTLEVTLESGWVESELPAFPGSPWTLVLVTCPCILSRVLC